MRGLSAEELARLREACGPLDCDGSDYGPEDEANQLVSDELERRGLVIGQEFDCPCNWQHFTATPLGREMLSIFESAIVAEVA